MVLSLITCDLSLAFVEAADGFDYGFCFVFAEFGIDRQGQDFVGGLFSDGEVALLVPEGLQALLQVEREWVIDFAADFVFGEVGAKGVAVGGADDVLVEDMFGARVGIGENDALFC